MAKEEGAYVAGTTRDRTREGAGAVGPKPGQEPESTSSAGKANSIHRRVQRLQC